MGTKMEKNYEPKEKYKNLLDKEKNEKFI